MNRTVVDKLTALRNMGPSWKKDQLINDTGEKINNLRDLLKEDEWSKINTAYNYSLAGYGREEFDKECNKLIQKYRHDPPERKRMLL